MSADSVMSLMDSRIFDVCFGVCVFGGRLKSSFRTFVSARRKIASPCNRPLVNTVKEVAQPTSVTAKLLRYVVVCWYESAIADC